MKQKCRLHSKTCIRIACFLLAVVLFCLLEYMRNKPRPVALENSSLYPYINKMEKDTFMEKKNNPESCYQTINGNVYIMEYGCLYKSSIGEDKMYKLLPNVRSFFVTEKFIFYCTEIGRVGNSLHRCDLDGRNDKVLYGKNVYACTMLEEDMLFLSCHPFNWSLGKFDLKDSVFKEIEIKGNISPKKICYHDNLAIYADTYNIRTVDIESGEVEELWSLYDDYEALAEVTCLYVYDDKIYYGVNAIRKKANSVTGLWRMDLDGKNQEQLIREKVNEICFVDGEYVILE